MRSDVIAVVESAYDLEARPGAWLEAIVKRAIPLVPGAKRGLAFPIDASATLTASGRP